jgi:hypothetical protein
MKTSWSYFATPKRNWRRRIADYLFAFIMGDRWTANEEKFDTLYRFLADDVSSSRRFKEDQLRLRGQHSDWLAECERAQNRHEHFIKLVEAQNSILDKMSRVISEK